MGLHACYFKDLGAFSTDQRRASATAGKTGTRATGQRNWPTHPAVPPGTDDQSSTPARELEPPQPLLRSLDGGQHPCAKIGANVAVYFAHGSLHTLIVPPGAVVLVVLGWHSGLSWDCLLYTSPSPRDGLLSRMPSSA